jgi:hypothetical protein
MTSKKATKKATKKVARKAAKKATKKVARKATKKVARKSGETNKDNFSFKDLAYIPLIILIIAAPVLFTAIFGGVIYFFFDGDTEFVETLWWLFLGGSLIFGLIDHCLSGGSSSTDYHANDNQFDGD